MENVLDRSKFAAILTIVDILTKTMPLVRLQVMLTQADEKPVELDYVSKATIKATAQAMLEQDEYKEDNKMEGEMKESILWLANEY